MTRYVPKRKFQEQRNAARRRNISFLLTFEEWWKFWQDSSHWYERGRNKGSYVMARFGDKGPYAVGNVKICTVEENAIDKKLFLSEETRDKLSKAHIGRKRDYWKKMTPEQKEQWSKDRTGHKNPPRTKEQRQKIIERRTGQKWTPEQRKRMSEEWYAKRNLPIPLTKSYWHRKKVIGD